MILRELFFILRVARGGSAVLCGLILASMDVVIGHPGGFDPLGLLILAMCTGCASSGAADLARTIFDAVKLPEPTPLDVRGVDSTLLNDWTPYLRGERADR